ncbi:MAG: HPF/RaiA family ribosome-associated protein [Alkalispirochaeta sp.]|jgi:putative sigma-54 modulation protein
MDMTIKSVHFNADDLTKELIETRLQRLDFAADKIVDVDFTLTREKGQKFVVTVKVSFRWGSNAVIKTGGYDLHKAINELFDKLDLKVRKEVEKIQEHKL